MMRSNQQKLMLGAFLSLWLYVLSVSIVFAQNDKSALDSILINHAELISLKGLRQVDLPNILTQEDFDPKGGLVHYRADVFLPFKPEFSLGIFLGKISLSARVYVNGELAGACQLGELAKIRCLHQPTLIVTPPVLWRAGHNQLDFEVYANDRQTNGLSSINVGAADLLKVNRYEPRMWWQVDLVEYLMWISLSLGILGVMVSLSLKHDSIFFWFGLTSIANSLSCLNTIITSPSLDMEWYSWLVFTSRFVTSLLFVLVVLAFFAKDNPKIKTIVITYAVIGAFLIGFTGNSRFVVVGLYVPCVIVSLILPGILANWARKSRDLGQITLTIAVSIVTIAALYDFSRLSGTSEFEGVYFMQYAYSGMLVVVGGLLFRFLVNSLIESRDLSETLELRVANRTDELEKAYQKLLLFEAKQSVSQERERLVRDMHDGFGSQLVTARLLVEQGNMTSIQLSQIIDECIDDLYLVIDSLADEVITLETALANFRYRVEQRLPSKALQIHWLFDFGTELPVLSQKFVLQILRILQEALNNIYKHAEAQNIWFEVRHDIKTGGLRICIMDDGKGLPAMNGTRKGCGLGNMNQRARQIGAELKVCNRLNEPGVMVELIINQSNNEI